ncbi:MAG: SBBP repeat-containing protein [Candidatus Jettenia caeni]|nr:MAG: SBBP repeat-containing protein [Candidatus Jettenia caeni]
MKAKVEENYGKLPLYFIQNDGQADEKVRFYERSIGHTTSFTSEGVHLSLTPASQSPLSHESTQFSLFYKFTNSPPSTESLPSHPFTKFPFSKGGHRGITKDNSPHNPQRETRTNQFVHATQPETIKLIPLGANKDPLIIPEGLQEAKVNYFIGKNSEDWKTNISTYQAILYKDIYQDIDMRFYGNNRQLEYDIIVKPGANPSRVQLSYQGIEDLKVTEEGDLEIALKDGKLIQKRPYVYQEIEGKRVERKGAFKVSRSGSNVRGLKHEARNSKHFIYAFQVASYDKRYPLVIDPVLEYSTYLGGSGFDSGRGIAVDTAGNVYVTGSTYSFDFPTVNALDGHLSGSSDLFVTKMNAAGTSLIFSTYFGGGSDYYFYDGDNVSGIAVDTVGNVYITGRTRLYDFPLVNAFDASCLELEAFITKIPSDLQVRYTCNEGSGTMVTDSSGNGNNGIIEGATWTTGREEGGLSFDGIDDSVSIPLINNEELSVCAWFYKNVNDTTNTDAIFGGARWNADPQLREGFDVRFVPSAPDTLRFVLTTQDTSGVRTTKEAQAKALNSVGSWHHVAGAYNKTTGEQKLYINSQLVDTKIHPAGNTAVPLSYSEMKVGYSKYGTGYFNGIIDDVRLYRRALSDKEVQGIYHAVTSGMQMHYTLDEGTGTIAHDASGNDNHGEIQGAVWTAGKSGNGLSFDGVNDSVSVPRMNHDEISLSAWFRKNTNDTSRADAIFSALRWSSDPQLREGFDVRFSPGSPDTLRYALVTMDGSGNKTTKTVKENLVNSVNTWYHVVCTYNMATGKQHLYVNGQLVDTDTHPAGNTIVPLTYYDDIRVGYSRYKTGYFNGLIDEVRLYRRALSDQEVQELYTNN